MSKENNCHRDEAKEAPLALSNRLKRDRKRTDRFDGQYDKYYESAVKKQSVESKVEDKMAPIKASLELECKKDFDYEAFLKLIPGSARGDANAINSLAALVDNSRDTERCTTENFRGCALDTRQLLTMEKLGGSEQYRLYLAFIKLKGIVTFEVPPNPNAPAGCPTLDEGFGIMPCNLDDPLTKKILGPHPNFREMFAKTAGFADWNHLLMSTLNKQNGWNQHPKTKVGSGGSLEQKRKAKLAMRIFHKADCKFSSGGPGRYGGGEAYAAYLREWRKGK